jgi:hypothetical protein
MIAYTEWAQKAIFARLITPEEIRKFESDWKCKYIAPSGSNYPVYTIAEHGQEHVWNNYDAKWEEKDEKIRCDYCGRKNDSKRELCASCGAVL